jgi:hydrogenase maturation protease
MNLVIGIGNRFRSDDSFGPKVIDRLAEIAPGKLEIRSHDGEPAGLIESWSNYSNVILVDAVSSGAPAGTLHIHELTNNALPEKFNLYSTHAFGIPQAVELGRALHKLPERLLFIGAEGLNFDAGLELSSPLEAALGPVLEHICRHFSIPTCEQILTSVTS